jgi:hypothetical protein
MGGAAARLRMQLSRGVRLKGAWCKLGCGCGLVASRSSGTITHGNRIHIEDISSGMKMLLENGKARQGNC